VISQNVILCLTLIKIIYDWRMNDFQTITTSLKKLLSTQQGKEVNDKALALALGLLPSTFSSMKRRGNIPYKAILDFCHQHNINANTLLFSRAVNNIYENPHALSELSKETTTKSVLIAPNKRIYVELSLKDLIFLFFYRSSLIH